MTKNAVKPQDPADKKFKGYTLEEIRYRLMINELKIRLEKGQLQSALSGARQQTEALVPSWTRNLEYALGYGQIAFFGFRILKKFGSLFKSFRKKR